MTSARQRPPLVADERIQLVGWLDLQRAIVSMKCEGLSDADAHRQVLPSSPLMTVAGVVSHLRWVENLWFEVLFLGRPAVGPQFDAIARCAAAHQHRMPGPVEQRRDRCSHGTGTDECNVGSDTSEITPPLRLGSRSKPEGVVCAAQPRRRFAEE